MSENEKILAALAEIEKELQKLREEINELRRGTASRAEFRAVETRLFELERQTRLRVAPTQLKPAESPPAPVIPKPAPPPPPPSFKPPEPVKAAEKQPDIIPPLPKIPPPPVIPPPPKLPPPPAPEPPKPPPPVAPKPVLPPTPARPPEPPKAPPRPPVRPPPPPPPPPTPAFKMPDWSDVESWVAVWGTRVGVFIVVLGLGYLLSIGFGKLSVFGKVIVVYAACVGMWATGIVFERLERYSTWAKIMIAGGWAGIYITTFLIHYLDEAKLIEDPAHDTFLLMGIAAGMIIHSFKYKSQALSALCYFVAFVTITLSIQLTDQTFFSLVATSVLAVSMLFIIYRLQWYWLAQFCLIACYGTHTIWLNPLMEGFNLPGAAMPEFWAGLAMLVLYWLTFTACAFLIKIADKKAETRTLWMTAMNYVSFVAVLRYQLGTTHPDWRWVMFASVGAAYIGVCYAAYVLKRSNLYALALVVAVISTTSSLYYRLMDGNWVSVGWLMQAEALYIAGILSDEKRFRLVGAANFVLVGIWLIAKDYYLATEVSLFGYTLFQRTVIYGTACFVFYLNAIIRKALSYRVKSPLSWSVLFGYAASALWLILMVKNWFPLDLFKAAVSSAFLGLVLMEIGIHNKDFHFRLQALFFSFMAVLTALAPLSNADELYYTHGIVYRIGCEAAVIAFAYIVFARFHKMRAEVSESRAVIYGATFFSGFAAIITVMLLYREFEPAYPMWLSLAWIVLAIALLEVGSALKNAVFRIEGYIIAGLSALWSISLFASWSESFGNPLMGAVNFALVIAGFYYLYGRILAAHRASSPSFSEYETAGGLGLGPILAAIFSGCGTLVLLLLIKQELIDVRPFFIAPSWLLAGVVLLEAGLAVKNRALRLQSSAVVFAAFVFAYFNNLDHGQQWWMFSERLATLSVSICAMYYIYLRHISELDAEKQALPSPRVAVPVFQQETGTAGPSGMAVPVSSSEFKAGKASGDPKIVVRALSWFASILLLLLIQQEVWETMPAWVGVATAAQALVFLLVYNRLKLSDFMHQAVALGILIFFWTLFVNIPPAAGKGYTIEETLILHSQRIPVVSIVIGLCYASFAALFVHIKKKAAPDKYLDIVLECLSWAGAVLLVALVTVEVNEESRAITTVAWMALAIVFYEVGKALPGVSFRHQGILLSLSVFARALWVNFPVHHGQFMFTSVRGVTLLAAIFGLYYFALRLRDSQEQTAIKVSEKGFGLVHGYLAAIVVSLLIYAEAMPAWIAPQWAAFSLVLLLAGIILVNPHYVIQSVVMVAPVIAAVLIHNFPLKGTFDGRLTSGIAIGMLFLARIAHRIGSREGSMLTAAEDTMGNAIRSARNLYSVPASILLVVLIVLEFSGPMSKYLTIALACEGLLLLILGFALSDRILRILGLLLLSFCILRVFYDLWVLDIERVYKVIALIGLGAILILTGWIYSRYREQLKKFVA